MYRLPLAELAVQALRRLGHHDHREMLDVDRGAACCCGLPDHRGNHHRHRVHLDMGFQVRQGAGQLFVRVARDPGKSVVLGRPCLGAGTCKAHHLGGAKEFQAFPWPEPAAPVGEVDLKCLVLVGQWAGQRVDLQAAA